MGKTPWLDNIGACSRGEDILPDQDADLPFEQDGHFVFVRVRVRRRAELPWQQDVLNNGIGACCLRIGYLEDSFQPPSDTDLPLSGDTKNP